MARDTNVTMRKGRLCREPEPTGRELPKINYYSHLYTAERNGCRPPARKQCHVDRRGRRQEERKYVGNKKASFFLLGRLP